MSFNECRINWDHIINIKSFFKETIMDFWTVYFRHKTLELVKISHDLYQSNVVVVIFDYRFIRLVSSQKGKSNSFIFLKLKYFRN